MPPLPLSLVLPASLVLVLVFGGQQYRAANAFEIVSSFPTPTIILLSSRRHVVISSPTALNADNNNRWWDNAGNKIFEFNGGQSNEEKLSPPPSSSSRLITREIEEEVMASAQQQVDSNAVSRAFSSLIQRDEQSSSLRDLALRSNGSDGSIMQNNSNNNNDISIIDNNKSNRDTHPSAIASGATTFLLSPLIIPIIHSLLPPIIPSPSSISVTGAALLGTLSYIVALGDPTDQSELGDGVEVSGAVSRIVGRTALQSAQASAPRIKAVARAIVDYDSTTATLEELEQLSQTVLQLQTENDELRTEVALWNAVEDVSSMYKLEELKEMARFKGLRGYSSDGKNALLRRLIREGIVKLDVGPYYLER